MTGSDRRPLLLFATGLVVFAMAGCGGNDSVDAEVRDKVEGEVRAQLAAQEGVDLSDYDFTCENVQGDPLLDASWRCETESSAGTLVCAVQTTFDAAADRPRLRLGNCDAQLTD
jgi:hypothetical protein